MKKIKLLFFRFINWFKYTQEIQEPIDRNKEYEEYVSSYNKGIENGRYEK